MRTYNKSYINLNFKSSSSNGERTIPGIFSETKSETLSESSENDSETESKIESPSSTSVAGADGAPSRPLP